MKHSPLIRLDAAQRAYETASEECAHWDMHKYDYHHECCHLLDDAQRELKAARWAAKRELEQQP